MTVMIRNTTLYPEVNDLLQELLESVRAILGSHFIGMYLDGSLASGDFDQESDIDFVVVTDVEISDDLILALEAMHERIAAIDSSWAIQLEGSYVSEQAIRRYDPTLAQHPNIVRGGGECLKMIHHDECWVIHRLQHGTIVSKRVAAPWAQAALDARWVLLIERASAGRYNPGIEPSSDDVDEMLEFIRYALERSQQFEMLME
jgi:predicted nucleotidyltransferase